MKTEKRLASEMKDSGVGWIGEIPEGWKIEKIGRSFETISSGTTPESSNLKYYEDGTINWVVTGDLNNSKLVACTNKITSLAMHDYSTLKIYPKNSLLIAMYGATIGKISLLDVEACTNQACCVLSGSQLFDMRFVFYWFYTSKEHIISLSYGGGQPNISQKLIRSLRLPRASMFEQETIVSFLDSETSKIQQLIGAKTKQIELLQEHEKSLIHHTVTKGLDPKAKMKYSGVKWIGEIPEGWGAKPISREYEVQLGKMLQPEPSQDAELKPYLRTANVFWNNFDLTEVNEMYVSSREKDQFSIVPGDLLVCEGGDVGRSAIWMGKIQECYIQNSLHRIRPLGKNQNKFLYYCLFAANSKGEVEKVCSKATIAHYTLVKIKRTKVPIPSPAEQKIISSFLDSETSKIHNAIDKIENEIVKLEEYRKSLIYEVVTGKVKVS